MAPRPTKPQTPSHDTVVKVTSHPTCPKCGEKFEHTRYVAIATESYPDVERDELTGLPILRDGKPVLKTRVAYSYIAIPRVATGEDMDEALKALIARRDPELELLKEAAQMVDEEKYSRKKPKAKTIAEAVA